MRFEQLTNYNSMGTLPRMTHCAVIGQSGAGKSHGIVLPMLRQFLKEKNSNAIIMDGKGELYRELAIYALNEGYDLHLYDFLHLEESPDRWNPLSAAYKYYKRGNTDAAMEDIRSFAEAVAFEESSKEVFWPMSSQNLLTALVITLFEFAPSEEHVNIRSILEMLSSLEDRKGSIEPLGKKICNMLPPNGSAALSTARAYLKAHMDGPTETRRSVNYTLLQHLTNMCGRSTALLSFLDRSSVKFDEIDFKKPMQLFWVILPDYTIYQNIGGLLVSQLCKEAVKAADSFPGQRLPIPMHLLVEEAGICKIPALPNLFATARSRNIKITLSLQDPFSQLDHLYTPLQGEKIRSNIGTYFVFPTSSWNCMRTFSAMCGSAIDSETGLIIPLLSAPEIHSMDLEKCLLIHGKYKGIIDTPFYFKTYGSCKISPILLREQNSQSEIKVLTVDDIISNKQNNTATSVPVSGGKFNGCNTPFIPDYESKSIEGMLDAIDKDFNEKKRLTPADNSAVMLFFVCLLNPCGHSKAIAKIMEDAIGIKRHYVEEALKYSLPVSYMFPSQKLAKETARKIVAEGGLAIVDERPAKKRNDD